MSAEMAMMVCRAGGLSCEERLVLLRLADHTNPNGRGEFRPADLVATTGIPAPAVERFIQSFAAAGFVQLGRVDPDGWTSFAFNPGAFRPPLGRKPGRRVRAGASDEAAARYRDEGNPLAPFLAEYAEEAGEDEAIPLIDIAQAYNAWSDGARFDARRVGRVLRRSGREVKKARHRGRVLSSLAGYRLRVPAQIDDGKGDINGK